jgi:hypothetical protein
MVLMWCLSMKTTFALFFACERSPLSPVLELNVQVYSSVVNTHRWETTSVWLVQTVSYANGPGYKYHYDSETNFWRNLSQVHVVHTYVGVKSCSRGSVRVVPSYYLSCCSQMFIYYSQVVM